MTSLCLGHSSLTFAPALVDVRSCHSRGLCDANSAPSAPIRPNRSCDAMRLGLDLSLLRCHAYRMLRCASGAPQVLESNSPGLCDPGRLAAIARRQSDAVVAGCRMCDANATVCADTLLYANECADLGTRTLPDPARSVACAFVSLMRWNSCRCLSDGDAIA